MDGDRLISLFCPANVCINVGLSISPRGDANFYRIKIQWALNRLLDFDSFCRVEFVSAWP